VRIRVIALLVGLTGLFQEIVAYAFAPPGPGDGLRVLAAPFWSISAALGLVLLACATVLVLTDRAP
jgi:hypothetical protein